MRTVLYNYRIVDAIIDINGAVVIDDEIITDVISSASTNYIQKINTLCKDADAALNGKGLCLTSGFVDMHAHFRQPGFPQKETLESASLAAVSGGYTTVCCMANTMPPVDAAEAAGAIRERGAELGLIDLYPIISLTKKMKGKKLSPFLQNFEKQKNKKSFDYMPLLLSEDGHDVLDAELFLRAMKIAQELNIPVSCHCDIDGEDAATERVIGIAKNTACRLHIAHVSTKKAAGIVRRTKSKLKAPGLTLSAEATAHHISLNKKAAEKLGAATMGKVAPPMRPEADRIAIIEALKDGTIDVIATDHAPHTAFDKENGSPGFSGLETSFAVCNKTLVSENNFSLKQLSALMSANPARILGLNDRGLIAKGKRADIAIVDLEKTYVLDLTMFKSRGKNTPYNGMLLTGKVLRTISNGKIVF